MSLRHKTRSIIADALYRGIKHGLQKASKPNTGALTDNVVETIEREVWLELDAVFEIDDVDKQSSSA